MAVGKVYYEQQLEDDSHIYLGLKNDCSQCPNKCYFCSRLNNFISVTDFESYNKKKLDYAKSKILNNKDKNNIYLTLEINFSHYFSIDEVSSFVKLVTEFENSINSDPRIILDFKIIEDSLLEDSYSVLMNYITYIVNNYFIFSKFKIKSIKLCHSFDFSGRFLTEKRINNFKRNMDLILREDDSELFKYNNITSNYFCGILLADSVRYVVSNFNNPDDKVISLFKYFQSKGVDLILNLVCPITASVLLSKNMKNDKDFCTRYCYISNKDLLEFNKLLNITEFPYGQLDNSLSLFYCNINGGCKFKNFCKVYNVNMSRYQK